MHKNIFNNEYIYYICINNKYISINERITDIARIMRCSKCSHIAALIFVEDQYVSIKNVIMLSIKIC